MILDTLKLYVRFCFGLKSFLTKKLSFPEARQTVKTRMGERQENFLKIVRQTVFEYPPSPYRPLLDLAGLSFKDVESLVGQRGLEGALAALCEKGVYVTIDELKARKPIVRGNRTWVVREKDFDNPYIQSSFEKRSGATRSPGIRIKADFNHLTDTAACRGVEEDARGLGRMPHIMVRPAHIYGAGVIAMLSLSKFNIPLARWFSPVDKKNIRIALRTRLGLRYIFLVGRLCGSRFPEPEPFSFGKGLGRVTDALRQCLDRDKACCVFSNVSTALRIALDAKKRGVDLTGAVFECSGEPLTQFRKTQIESTGAVCAPYYAFSELTRAGVSCLRPVASDDIHLFLDICALITRKRPLMDGDIDAFLFTTLLFSSPKVLLNAENGDYGTVERRRCGCPYEELGYLTHVSNIRSFEKLTGEGQTFYGTELIRLVEEVLPARFGGTSLDYQLAEETDERGFGRLVIFISPRVGPVDEREVVKAVLAGLGQKEDHARVMREIWSQAGAVSVRRQEPRLTNTGKLFPLYILQGDKK